MARVFAQTQDCHQPEATPAARQPVVIAGTLQAAAGPREAVRSSARRTTGVPARRSSSPARSWPVALDRIRRRHVLGASDEAYVRALGAAQVLRARRAATMFPFWVWRASAD